MNIDFIAAVSFFIGVILYYFELRIYLKKFPILRNCFPKCKSIFVANIFSLQRI